MDNNNLNNFDIFPWNKNFETGIKDIDEQHKKLVEILNRLAVNLAHRSSAILLDSVFNELVEYTDYHFKSEEIIWNEHLGDDPWSIQHNKTHNSFIEKVLKLKNQQTEENSDKIVQEIVAFLTHWLAYHILDSDKRMAFVAKQVILGAPISEAKDYADKAMSGMMKTLIDTVLNMYDSLSVRTLDLMREKALRKQAEQALLASEERWNFIVKGSEDSIWEWNIVDEKAGGGFNNSPFFKFLIQNDDNDKIIDNNIVKIHSEDIKRVNENLQSHLDGATAFFASKYRVLLKNNSWSWISSKGKVVERNSEGEAIRIVGTHTDITERELGSLIFKQSYQSIIITDTNYDIKNINPTFVETTGFSDTEIYGNDLFFWFSEKDKNENIFNIKKEINDNGIWTGEVLGIKKNGEVFTALTNILPISNAKESFNYFVMMFTDISDRKEMEKKLLKSKEKVEKNEQKLIDAQAVAKVGSWETNLITMDVVWSDETYKIFGLDKEQFKKTHVSFLDYVHPDDIERIEDVFAKSFSSKDYNSVQHRIITPSGELKHVEERWITFHDSNDKPLVSFGTCQDITENIIIQNQLKSAKEKAEESNRLKSAFLANMSHEIRTPMSGILGFSELLKNPELTPEKQGKYIEIIEKSGNRLLTTINDIIDISKIESGLVEARISEVQINPLLEELFLFFKVEADKKGISLLLKNNLKNDQAVIKTDAVKLNGILTNLVKNAIKFTKEGSVEIGCKLNNVNIEFTIKDTGIGVPKSRQPFIFDRFVQADIEDKDVYEGSGLGLAIVMAYVKMLNGAIQLESEEGKGSVFYVSLPISSSIKKEIEFKNEEIVINTATQTKPIKILIIEDDEVAQLFLMEILAELPKEILIAGDGARAIEQVKQNPNIDLILMDIKLPDMDGYEVTKQIRAFNKEVIIIAQTAYMFDDKAKALLAGCNDYVSKPINKLELDSLIQKYFDK